MQAEHGEGLVQCLEQPRIAEIIGADEAIPGSVEHPNASAHAEGWADAGNQVLFGQNTEVVGALKEHFHQIGAGLCSFG